MIKTLYDFMAYTQDKEKKYEVVDSNTSFLKNGEIISYVGTKSFDGDIDEIVVFNHNKQDEIILSYKKTLTLIKEI